MFKHKARLLFSAHLIFSFKSVKKGLQKKFIQDSLFSHYAELFKEVIIDTHQNQTKDNYSKLVKKIDEENNKIRKARELLVGGNNDGGDYKMIKSECEHKIECYGHFLIQD